MNKTVTMPIAAGLVIIFAAAGFYGGMQYQKKQSTNNGVAGFQRGQMLGNGTGQGGQRPGQVGQRGGTMRSGNSLSGEVLKMDDKSVTVKLNDGGSKTAYFTASTSVDKSVAGVVADLKAGDRVVVNGKANADGSVNAEMIQIRPNLPIRNQPPKQ